MAVKKTTHTPTEMWEGADVESSIEASRRHLDNPRYAISDDFAHKGTLYFPPELIPEGWVYGFVNERLMNEDQPENISEMYRKGWDFVKASDHPEFAFPKMDHRYAAGLDDGNIRIKGSILMKLPKEVFLQRQRKYEQEADNIRKQSAALTDYLGQDKTRFNYGTETGFSPIYERSR